MADPVSICISTAAAARVVFQSSVSLYSFIEGSIHIDQSILALLDEFNSLKNIALTIADTVSNPSIRDQAWLDNNAQEVFALLEGSLKGCNDNLQRFKNAIVEIKSNRFTTRIMRQPIAKIKLNIKSSRIVLLRGQISSHFSAMQLGLQTINLSASLRGPEMVIEALSSKINQDVISFNNRVDDKFEGFDAKILERMDDLERLIMQSSQRLNDQSYSLETFSTSKSIDNEIQLKEAASRVVLSARSVVSSRSTVADGSVYNFAAHQRSKIQDPSIYGSELGEEKLQGIAQWTSGLEPPVEGSETGIGLESSSWTATANDSDSDEDIANDLFNGLFEKGKHLYTKGEIVEAEATFRRALNVANTKILTSKSAQNHNDIILKLAAFYSKQKKFIEAREVLTYLCLSKVDLSPWEVQQKIQGSHLLANANLELKELHEAEKICQDTLRACRRAYGKKSLDYQESLKLLIAIHEAQGDLEPMRGQNDRSGRDSIASSFAEPLHSPQPSIMQIATTIESPSGVGCKSLLLCQKTEVEVQSTASRVQRKPLPGPQKAEVGVENVTNYTGEFINVAPGLPGETAKNKVSNKTTALSALDKAKLKTTFSYLESDPKYNFLSAKFQPQIALTTAIVERHREVAWSLLNQLMEVEQRYQENLTYRILSGLMKKPDQFPSKLDVDYGDDKGPLLFQTLWPTSSSPLKVSMDFHQYDMANILLKAGSNPNIKWSGVTPLMRASDKAQWDLVKLLLEAGADVNCTDENNQTALHFALKYKDSVAEEAVCNLIEHGADVNIVVKQKKLLLTALTVIVLWRWDKATKAFLKHGANTEQRSSTKYYSPLGVAAAQGLFYIAKLLLDGGANIESKNYLSPEYNPETYAPPLYIAAFNGHFDLVQLFIYRGANIEGKQSRNEETPLSVASARGFKDVVKILLEHKADIMTKDVQLCTPLYLACEDGHADVVRMLIEHGADLECRSNNGTTPLCVALLLGHREVVRILLTSDADINVIHEYTMDPLQLAAKHGHLQIVQFLLDKSVEIDAIDASGHTALSAACKEQNLDMAKYLLKRGANSNLPKNDQSPLKIAKKLKNEKMEKMLRDAGAVESLVKESGEED